MYRIGICDDDKKLCGILEEEILSLSKELKVKFETYVWYTGEGLCHDLEKELELELLFLDIELMEKDGIEVGRFIRNEMENMRTHIVYISSKENYAMSLFKLQPLDFLIKPITRGQLIEVLSRSLKQNKKVQESFEYQKGGTFCRIPYDEICYFASMDKKIRIVHKGGDGEFYGKLKNISERLPGQFLMIHQSYIINQDFAEEYTYEQVKMRNGDVLSISRPYRKEVRSKVKQFQKEKMDAGL